VIVAIFCLIFTEVGQTIFKKGISKKNTGQKTKSNKSNLSGKKISKGRGRGKGGTAAKGIFV